MVAFCDLEEALGEEKAKILVSFGSNRRSRGKFNSVVGDGLTIVLLTARNDEFEVHRKLGPLLEGIQLCFAIFGLVSLETATLIQTIDYSNGWAARRNICGLLQRLFNKVFELNPRNWGYSGESPRPQVVV